MRQNVAGFAVAAVIVAFGAWLIERLDGYSRTLACIEHGHRACLVVDVQKAGVR